MYLTRFPRCKWWAHSITWKQPVAERCQSSTNEHVAGKSGQIGTIYVSVCRLSNRPHVSLLLFLSRSSFFIIFLVHISRSNSPVRWSNFLGNATNITSHSRRLMHLKKKTGWRTIQYIGRIHGEIVMILCADLGVFVSRVGVENVLNDVWIFFFFKR